MKMHRRKRHANPKFKKMTSDNTNSSLNDTKSAVEIKASVNRYEDPNFRTDELKKIKDLLENRNPRARDALDSYLDGAKDTISKSAANLLQTYVDGKVNAISNPPKVTKDSSFGKLEDWMANYRKDAKESDGTREDTKPDK